jgi:tripartite-type tricarboxylate transporter receptor subunit TctC
MKLPRRKFLHLAAGAAALPAMSHIAKAETHPSRPVRIIVAASPGSAPDIVARLIGQWLSERLGQPFVVDNRPGAAGSIAAEAVVRAPPDGYVLLLVASANAVNATLFDKLNYNFIRDIAPVAGIVRAPNVMAIHPAVQVSTVPEFIAYAKANPGKMNFASAGSGTSSHMSAELFKMMTGINMVHVPYRGGGPALTDLIGGQVQVMFPTTTGALEPIRAGKLRALAVTTATRLEELPDVPAASNFVPGYESSGWFGVGAPKSTPAETIDKLNKEINAALANASINARLADIGGTPLSGSAPDFGNLIADETEKWGKVIKFFNIKPE